MIYKVIEKNEAGGGLKTLVNYVLQEHKVDWSYYSDAVQFRQTASLEMQALAARRPDIRKPSVHVTVGWDNTDAVQQAQMEAVVKEMAETLGLKDHLYMAVAHRDAMHQHLHFVACRIHPETLRPAYLSFSKRKLRTLAEQQERRYGWHQTGEPMLDNTPIRIGENEWTPADLRPARLHQGARSSHLFVGRESFQEWIAGEPRSAVFEALNAPDASWARVHRALAQYGIRYNVYGQGGSLSDVTDERRRAQAGQIGRFMCLPQLEARLGPYQPAAADMPYADDRSYAAQVLSRPVEEWGPPELTQGYRAYRAGFQADRKKLWAEQMGAERERKVAIRRTRSAKLAALRTEKDLPMSKQILRNIIYAEARDAMLETKEQIAQERAALRHGGGLGLKPLSERAWVMAQAKVGNTVAQDFLEHARLRERLRIEPPKSVSEIRSMRLNEWPRNADRTYGTEEFGYGA